jgi:hypothetical protein
MTTVLVGPTRVPFHIHKDLVCWKSKFFEGALNGGFPEAQNNCVTLADEKVTIFKLFVDWLYEAALGSFSMQSMRTIKSWLKESGGAESDSEDEDCMWDDDDDDDSDPRPLDTSYVHGSGDDQCSGSGSVESSKTGTAPAKPPEIGYYDAEDMQSTLVDLYIFADRRDVQTLKHAVMDRLIALRHAGWPLLTERDRIMRKAYECLPEGSLLLIYLVDEAAYCWHVRDLGDNYYERLEGLPPAFAYNNSAIRLQAALYR